MRLRQRPRQEGATEDSMKKVFCGALVFVDVHAGYYVGGGTNIAGGGTNIKAIGHAARNG